MTLRIGRRSLLAGLLALPGVAALARVGLLGRQALAQTGPLTEHHVATLERLAYQLFPYADLGSAPYGRVAGAIAAGAADVGTRALVDAGIAALDEAAGGAWLDLDEDAQVAALRDIEGEAFFQHVLQMTRVVLFNDPEVWSYLGYGGSSLEFGGYLDRGLNDIDWLDGGG